MNLKGLAAATIAALALSLAAAPRLPDGWAVSASQDAARDCRAQAGGFGPGPGLVLQCRRASSGSFELSQSIDAAPYRGRRVSLSARVRAEGLAGRAGLLLKAEAADRSVLALDDMRLNPLQGTTGWREARVLLDVDAQAAVVTLGVAIEGGPGTAWVESLRFELTDPADPGLAVIVRPAAPTLPAQPRNLGFER